ncbi:MAG: outer membrane beta-barrel protein [Bacteroidetes bacterium]|nr:outer membrane beta-barrel protein [Bacteroidota bacterium]
MRYGLTIWCLLILTCVNQTHAQIHLDAYAGASSTSLNLGSELKNGGTYPIYGIDLEGRLKPKRISRFHLAAATGAAYLANGYNLSSSFTISGLYYDARTTNISQTYIQVPFVLRLNWQPSPLVEDFHLFLGMGVVSNWLMEAKISETSDHVGFSALAAPPTTHYEDSRDVTKLAVPQSFFFRYEIGVRYKRVTVIIRSSLSLQDMYYQGIEQVWRIPATSSAYISGHSQNGKITEKQGDMIVNFRIF